MAKNLLMPEAPSTRVLAALNPALLEVCSALGWVRLDTLIIPVGRPARMVAGAAQEPRWCAPVLLCIAGRREVDDDLGPGGPHLHAAPPVGERALTPPTHVDK